MGSIGAARDNGNGNIDFTSQGTYSLNGQSAPSDMQKFNGTLSGNPTVNFRGQDYQLQNVTDWDDSEGGEYTAGYLYVPINPDDKGSFFLSKDNTLYHDGSQYLIDKRRNRYRNS